MDCDLMCGIVGIVSYKPLEDKILEGLEKIQYRGYDSAGIAAFLPDGELLLRKKGLTNIGLRVDGFLSEIRSDGSFLEKLKQAHLQFGQTRWATHGPPSDNNAHPHRVGDVILVHNGINNNHSHLVDYLKNNPSSETDTEQITALINELYDGHSLLDSTIDALNFRNAGVPLITGSNAIVLASLKESNKIIAAQINGRPLYVGISEDTSCVCSDIPTLVRLGFRWQIPLESGEVAVLTPGKYEIYDLNRNRILRELTYNSMKDEDASKGGFPHYMLGEMANQGKSIKDAQELDHKKILEVMDRFSDTVVTAEKRGNKIYLIGNGTSFYAAMFGKGLFTSLGISTEAVSGRDLLEYPVKRGDVILAVSQSGETHDILQSTSFGEKSEAEIYSLANVIGSTLTRTATYDGVSNNMYINCGPEIGVVATKSFLSQLYRFIEMYEMVAQKTRQKEKIIYGIKEELPQIVHETVDLYLDGERLNEIIELIEGSRAVEFIGLGRSYPIALEGALKLKETAYIPSEGVLAHQLKHGPISLFDPENPKSIPLVSVVSYDNEDSYDTMKNNISQVNSRKGITISVVRDNKNDEIRKMSSYPILIQDIPSPYFYLLAVVPLQLLAYHLCVKLGYDPDKPRNLAKSVTVE